MKPSASVSRQTFPMTKTRLLDQGVDTEIAEGVIEVLEEAGYSVEEMIPGLILAISLVAEKSPDPEAYLDEAANLLADGPAGDEFWEDDGGAI